MKTEAMVNSTVDFNANGEFDLNSECSKGSVVTIEDKTREFMNLIKNEMKLMDDVRFDNSSKTSPEGTSKNITSDSDQDSDTPSDDENENEDDQSLV